MFAVRLTWSSVEAYAAGPILEVRRVLYEYYGDDDDHGGLDDLQRVRAQVPAGAGWEDAAVHYYRYYRAEDPDGFAHGLKFVLGPAAWERLAAIEDPLAASDATLAQFADFHFRYDAARRVSAETVQSGARTFTEVVAND